MVHMFGWRELLQHVMFVYPTSFAVTLFLALSCLLVTGFLGYHFMHVMQVRECNLCLCVCLQSHKWTQNPLEHV